MKKPVDKGMIVFFILVGVVVYSMKLPAEDMWARFMCFIAIPNEIYWNKVEKNWTNKSSDFLIGKLGTIYEGVACRILVKRHDLSKEDKLIKVLNEKIFLIDTMFKPNIRRRESALAILFYWDEKKAIELAMSILGEGRQHPLYDDAAYHLSKRKYSPAFPYIAALANAPDRFNNGSIPDLEDIGSMEALQILEGMLSDPSISKSDESRVKDAIKSIKEQNHISDDTQAGQRLE